MEVQKPTLTILDKPTIDRIIDEAMSLLEKAGITVEDSETLDILGQMGAEVLPAQAKAKIKRAIVENAIESAPKHLTLYDLAGNERFSFGDDQIHFDPGSAALFLYDAKASVMRSPKIKDVVRFARLCDTLENIEATSTGLIPSDVHQDVSDSIRLYISCLFSEKPVVTGTFSQKGFPVMRDLLLARTGEDSLRTQPRAIFDVCPSSPLRWSKLGCHDLKLCAQNAIPAQLIAMPLAGALSPMSLMATVVQHTVETLSGIIIHQAWTPGSPIIYGGSPAVFDMRYATSPMGAVETLLVDVAYAEVGKSFGLPVQAYLGMSDAKTLDAQAGMETAMTVAIASTGKIDLVSGPGMLNFESCQCLEKLVLDNQICGMARRLKQGIEPRRDTLGMDAIMEGLKEGYYLTLADTLRLYREETYYPTDIVDRKAFKEEGNVNSSRLTQEAALEVEKRLDKYEAPKITDQRLRDMKAVMERALTPYGLKHVAAQCLKM
jgi:trimethylamine--corrinoid protein Co-methyltransferase